MDEPQVGDQPPRERLRRAEFGFPRTELRRRLVQAILRGEKTATAGLLLDFEREGALLPQPGERQVLVDERDRHVGIIQTTAVQVVPMGRVDLQFARDEGEGFESVEEWRAAHEHFFGAYLGQLREWLGDPDWQLGDETLIVCERFTLVDRFDDRSAEPPDQR